MRLAETRMNVRSAKLMAHHSKILAQLPKLVPRGRAPASWLHKHPKAEAAESFCCYHCRFLRGLRDHAELQKRQPEASLRAMGRQGGSAGAAAARAVLPDHPLAAGLHRRAGRRRLSGHRHGQPGHRPVGSRVGAGGGGRGNRCQPKRPSLHLQLARHGRGRLGAARSSGPGGGALGGAFHGRHDRPNLGHRTFGALLQPDLHDVQTPAIRTCRRSMRMCEPDS